MNYPSIRMDIDRVHAGELGLSQKDVVDNVITALNSNLMIAARVSRRRPQVRKHERPGRALEADQSLRDELQRISRDVRVAWAGANDAYQRIDVTAQFLRQATLALQLAQGRYDLSLASIVELTQAQLNVTSATIENLSAKYDYETQYAALQFTLGLLR
jgi:outer membrane protein TolC